MDYTGVGLEGSAVLLILVVVYKVYKMRINSSSRCCGDNVEVDTYNPGGGELPV